ncbi:hypothetical protein IC620_10695 [Hazenella sp. IB182357]|uniref:Secreted protein n=1 Tax=Polycladospora coralii TaxID=2771432 RepID=A0A926RUD1_9BACL|nr:hypothetical protein [Polycladospora coralii]MBD1372823.1 hypothetical protein [Polycladospora coralii]MBS7529479.1 hypothetical protein [Polycladospora coralii]
MLRSVYAKFALSFMLILAVSFFNVTNAYAAIKFTTNISTDSYFHLKLDGKTYSSIEFTFNDFEQLDGLEISTYHASDADETANLIDTIVLDGDTSTAYFEIPQDSVYNIKMAKLDNVNFVSGSWEVGRR